MNLEGSGRSLYKLAGAACLVLIGYSLATGALLVVVGGPPGSAAECFKILQENRLVGLIRLDMLTVMALPLYYLLILGVWAGLRKAQPASIDVAAVIGCAGLTLVLSHPSVFSMARLSDQYAAAATDQRRSELVAAGEALLASDMWHASGAVIGGMLLEIALIFLSLGMLRVPAFGRLAAWSGMLTHSLDLGHILLGFVEPRWGVILMAAAGPPYLVWFFVLARRLLRLGRAS